MGPTWVLTAPDGPHVGPWTLLSGLLLVQWEATISTIADILFVGLLETNYSEIWIKMQQSSYKKINFTMLSVKCQSFCFGLNVLTCLLQKYFDLSLYIYTNKVLLNENSFIFKDFLWKIVLWGEGSGKWTLVKSFEVEWCIHASVN